MSSILESCSHNLNFSKVRILHMHTHMYLFNNWCMNKVQNERTAVLVWNIYETTYLSTISTGIQEIWHFIYYYNYLQTIIDRIIPENKLKKMINHFSISKNKKNIFITKVFFRHYWLLPNLPNFLIINWKFPHWNLTTTKKHTSLNL